MDPVQTVSNPLSDVAGVIVFDSQVPVLEINVSTGVTVANTQTVVDLTIAGSTAIKLDYDLFSSPPGNIGETLSFSGLLPNFNNQIFYESFGGITFATALVATRIAGVPLIVKNLDAVVAPSNELNPILNTFRARGVRYHDNYWYAFGSKFIMSPNGMNWSGTETDCPFLDTISDLSFDNAGLGIAISSRNTFGYSMSALLSNKIFMPVDLTSLDITSLYCVIFATRWVAAGTDSSGKIVIIESTNGFFWTKTTTDVVASSASIFWEQSTNVYFVSAQDSLIKLSTPGSLTTSVLTGLEYIGIAGSGQVNVALVRNTANTEWAAIQTGTDMTSSPLSTNFTTEVISVQYDGTKFTIIDVNLREHVSVDGASWTPGTFSYVGSDVVAFTSNVEQVLTLNGKTLDAETFVTDPSVVPSDVQTFEYIPSTIQFVASGATGGIVTTPARNGWNSVRAYSSFELKFNSDVYSSKQLNFIAGGESFTFNILEAISSMPYDIKNNTNQSNGNVYNFIQNGVEFAQSVDVGVSYERLATAMLVCVSLYSTLISLFEGGSQVPGWVDMTMLKYVPFCLNGNNTRTTYNVGTFNSIRSLYKVGTTDPVTGGATGNYDLATLGSILATLNDQNFNTFETNFAYSVLQNGAPVVNFTNGTLSEFTEVLESAMAGPNEYTFATTASRGIFINQLIKLFSLEYLVSTDYTVDSMDTNSILANAPLLDTRALLIQIQANLQNVLSALNTGRSPSTKHSYTISTEFSVKYNGRVLSLSVGSNLINEFYVFSRAPIRIELISNSYQTPIALQDGLVLPAILGFNTVLLQEHPDVTVRLKKKIGDIRDARLSLTTRTSFFDEIEKTSLLGEYRIPLLPNDIDYYYAISAFTQNTSLLQICGTKILQGSTTFFDSNNFSGTSYDSNFPRTSTNSFITVLSSIYSASLRPTSVFSTFRNNVLSYYASLGNYTPVRDIRDNKYIVDTYMQMNYLYKITNFLTNTGEPQVTQYTFPPIPGKDLLFNEYDQDLTSTISQHSILKRLGNNFMCRTDDIFGTTLFNDTGDDIVARDFLNLLKGLTGLTDLAYEKVFASFQDAIGVTTIADAICAQQLSSVAYSYEYIKSLNNSSRFLVEGSTLASTFSFLGVTLTGGMTLASGVSLCIYDESYPTTLAKYYNSNYRNKFPDSPKLWSPLSSLLPQFASNISYIQAFSDVLSTDGASTPLLDLGAYYNGVTRYRTLDILPKVSNLSSAESGILFTSIVLPQIAGVIERAFELDVGNTKKYFTDAETKLFTDNYKLGSTAAFYAGLTGSSSIITTTYVDMNSVYATFATEYNAIVRGKLATLIASSNSDIASLSDGLLSILNKTYAPLQDYNTSISRINAQAAYYRSTLADLRRFIGINTIYKNFADSLVRFNQINSEILAAPVVPFVQPPENSSEPFIVAIPPLDATRWAKITIPAGKTLNSYSRYNSVWKYFDLDIVYYNGDLYQCIDTSRRYEVQGVPPGGPVGGEQRPYGLYQAKTPVLELIPGTTGYQVVQRSFVLGATHSAGVSSLLAWEEWHDGPTLSKDILNAAIPTNTELLPTESSYTIDGVSGGNPYTFRFNTRLYDSTAVYAKGELVIWGNSVFRCRGGYELIEGVGMGIPPAYTQSSVSWALLGTVGSTDIIPPGSNGVWKKLGAPLQTNRYVDNRYLPYNDTSVYNIGDMVIYDNTVYQRLANGTVLDQAGRTVTITGIPPPSSLTARGDLEWIAYPHIDLSVEGRKIPAYKNGLYNAGDLVVYNNLVWKNLLNPGSVGTWIEGTQYSVGDIVVTYDTFKYVSLVNDNQEEPPYPRNTSQSSIYWKKIGELAEKPAGMPEYNFETDYNMMYHINAGVNIQVYYDGAVWQWNYTMGIDYSRIGEEFSLLIEDGLVSGVEPPAPEPYNDWVVCYPETNINPKTKELIYDYSPDRSYKTNDIVFYENLFFLCTGESLGPAVNTAGDIVETQLFVPSREINFGRILYDDVSKTRYSETFITTEGVNEDDVLIPKWGDHTGDPWNAIGFARELRYNFAAGLELTYLTLKHDREVYSAVGNVNIPSSITSLLLPNISVLQTKSTLDQQLTSVNVRTIDNTFRNTEFYYYTPLVKYFYEFKKTLIRLRSEINAIYDDWILYHTQQNINRDEDSGISDYAYGLYGQTLQSFIMKEDIRGSVAGVPLFTSQQGLKPFSAVGEVVLLPEESSQDKIDRISNEYIRLGLSNLNYLQVTPNRTIDLYGETGKIGTTGSFFYNAFMGSSGYNVIRYADGSPAIYLDTSVYYNSSGIIPLSSFVIGYKEAVATVNEKQSQIAEVLLIMNSLSGMEFLTKLLGVTNVENFTPSLYRQNVFQKTGTDYPIYVPILTESDKKYLKTNTEVRGYPGATGFKPNLWFTGTGVLPRDNSFTYSEEYGVQYQKPYPQYQMYLTEELNFDLKPNFYRFNEVSTTFEGLMRLSNEQLKTGALSLTTPIDINVWTPFGDINQYAPNWALKKDWKPGSFFEPNLINEKADAYWTNTRYNPGSVVVLTRADLLRYQGKKSFVNYDPADEVYPHMGLLQYMFHAKKCSQLEASTALPNFVANAIKQVNRQKEYNSSMQGRTNELKVFIVASVAFVAVVSAIAVTVGTFGAAGPVAFTAATAIITAQSVAYAVVVGSCVGAVLYGFTKIPEYGPFLGALFFDQTSLFLPTVDTDAGLISRCALLDSLVELLSPVSQGDLSKISPLSAISQYVPEKSESVSYQLYKFSKTEYSNIYNTVLPEILTYDDPNVILINPGFLEFMKDKGITDNALVTYYQNNIVAGRNSESYIDFLAYAQSLLSNILRYENSLFLPVVFPPSLVSRPAVLQVLDVQFGPDIINSDGSTTSGPTGRPPGYSSSVFANIAILDPGEGFYLFDREGNKIPYISYLPIPATRSYVTSGGITLTAQDIKLIGRYLYDSTDITKTANNGLATFKHSTDFFGSNKKIQFETSGGAELNNQTFLIYPPVYSQAQTSLTVTRGPGGTIIATEVTQGQMGTNPDLGKVGNTKQVFEPKKVVTTTAPNASPPTPDPTPDPTPRPAVKPDPTGLKMIDEDIDLPKQQSFKGKTTTVKLTSVDALRPGDAQLRSNSIKTPGPVKNSFRGVLSDPAPKSGGLTIRDPEPPRARFGKGRSFKLASPNYKLTIRKPFPPKPPRPGPINVNGWGVSLAVLGVALTIAFAVMKCEELLKEKPPATDCTGIASNNH